MDGSRPNGDTYVTQLYIGCFLSNNSHFLSWLLIYFSTPNISINFKLKTSALIHLSTNLKFILMVFNLFIIFKVISKDFSFNSVLSVLGL